jgi:hypothetical protein
LVLEALLVKIPKIIMNCSIIIHYPLSIIH